MASGFIELRNGNSFSPRWTGYDATMRLIVRELKYLPGADAIDSLIKKIQRVSPPEDLKDEYEAGWGFINPETDEMLARIFRLSELTDKEHELFWQAANTANEKLKAQGEDYSYLNPEIMQWLIDEHNTE